MNVKKRAAKVSRWVYSCLYCGASRFFILRHGLVTSMNKHRPQFVRFLHLPQFY